MGTYPNIIKNNPWNSYRQVATQTAAPGQLVLMLFEGAIRFLEQARQGFRLEDEIERIPIINNNILRAQDIINELNYSLNIRDGGELAATLQRLYDYFDRRLTESNMHKTEDGVVEIIGRLRVLRDAWSTMLSRYQANKLTREDYAPLCAVG